jgi:hypothetical protein
VVLDESVLPGEPVVPGMALPSEPVPAEGAGPEAGEQPKRVTLADLARHPRARIWKLRAFLAVAAGVAFSILLTWRAGLMAAVIVAIADTVYRSRAAAAAKPGGPRLRGPQRRTQRQLSKLERAGYRALNARPIPGSAEYIDHLVIGPTGIYSIDSEAWDKKLPIRTKNARQLWHGPYSKKDRLEHARWEAGQASELLGKALSAQITVRPAMAVYGPKISWDITTIRDVDVFKGGTLRKYLRKHAKKIGMRQLSAGDIDKIYEVAERVLPLEGETPVWPPVGLTPHVSASCGGAPAGVVPEARQQLRGVDHATAQVTHGHARQEHGRGASPAAGHRRGQGRLRQADHCGSQ